MGAGLMQPIAVAVSWAVIGAHACLLGIRWLWQKSQGQAPGWQELRASIGRAILVGILSAPLLVYTLLSFTLDPFLRNWETQNVLTSPPFSDYLLAYAVVLPPAVLGVRAAVRNSAWRGWFVTGLAALFSLLIYLPLTTQRRLVEGAWVGLVILALVWIESRGSLVNRTVSRVLSLAFVTSIIFLVGICLVAVRPAAPLFVPAGEVKVFQYLAENTRRGEVVLASDEVSNPLPAWAAMRTIGGHGPESVNAAQMLAEKKAFFQPSTPDARRVDFLAEHHIAYVFYSPAERAYGGWDPAQAPFLTLVFDEDGYSLYQVNLAESSQP
jgi:hypothetical protein